MKLIVVEGILSFQPGSGALTRSLSRTFRSHVRGSYLLMFKVRGKFYGKELRPFGNLTLKALALAGYSNNEVGKSMKGESHTLPRGPVF